MVDIKRNVARARVDDGLTELVAGFGLLVAAGYLGQSSTGRASMTWVPALLPVFIGLGMKGLRSRFVYPRIGFAQPRMELSWPAIVAVAAVLGLALAVLLTSRYSIFGWQPGPGIMAWVPAIPALGGAGLLASSAVQAGRPRFWIHAAVLAVAAVVPALLGLRAREHLFFALLAPAVTMLPTGIVTFIRFLRSHPVQEVRGDA